MTRHPHPRPDGQLPSRAPWALISGLALAAMLSACGGGDDGSTTPAATDPTVSALSGQLSPDSTGSAATPEVVPASQLPPDAAAASAPDASLMPPS